MSRLLGSRFAHLTRRDPLTLLGLVLALAAAGMLGLEPHRDLVALDERLPSESEPAESDPVSSEEGKLAMVRQCARELRARGALPRVVTRARPLATTATPRPPVTPGSRSPFARGSPVAPPLLC